MCGIVGYTGREAAAPIILDGLSKLEYRGYDSAGMATFNADTQSIEIAKTKGRLKNLIEMTDGGNGMTGGCGIGHTRWATHGVPSKANAHPHYNDDRTVALVHNGIIENYQELKEHLMQKGYTFYSETDTEVVTKLIDYYYNETDHNPLESMSSALLRVRGSYALGVMFKDRPGVIYAARKDSPLIVGQNENGAFIASDVPAILSYTRNVYYLDNLEMAELREDGVKFFNFDRDENEKEMVTIEWDAESAEKGGYEHFMMKEIHEQPKAVRDTIGAYVKDGAIDLSSLGMSDEQFRSFRRICIVACGSAYHVGITAKYVMEDLTDAFVDVDLASEFRYRNPKLSEDTLVIVISQSGETADSLAALRLVKERGIKTLGIVNVVGSSIAREADYVMYTLAGPEIAVATTKAYSTQLICIYLLSMYMAKVREEIEEDALRSMIQELEQLPDKIAHMLSDKERIQWFANKFASARDIFFIGRGLDYSICQEGSLKMKEISYVHSEAYAAGELKHGTISLIEEGTLVVGLLTQSNLSEKTLSNMQEVKSRGAYLMGVTENGNYYLEDMVDFVVYIPKTDSHFTTTLAIVPLQLMGYYVSVARGLDVDKPRNLAKSVTVE
ncbi:MAG: glutamine--fructose-6-phosphate transaminase (isomerizing) [Eubacteriales bacterium]|nr:glutamine--fructose-6-phosphate transaminase (isomerizing) [Eubacteriales bacterium]